MRMSKAIFHKALRRIAAVVVGLLALAIGAISVHAHLHAQLGWLAALTALPLGYGLTGLCLLVIRRLAPEWLLGKTAVPADIGESTGDDEDIPTAEEIAAIFNRYSDQPDVLENYSVLYWARRLGVRAHPNPQVPECILLAPELHRVWLNGWNQALRNSRFDYDEWVAAGCP